MVFINDKKNGNSTMKRNLFLLVILGLFSVMSVNGALWSCWFNDYPTLGVDMTIYNSSGDVISYLDSSNFGALNSVTIDEGDIIQLNFTDTTDEENNINYEKVYLLDATTGFTWDLMDDNDLSFQATNYASTYVFDFYKYLTGYSQLNFYFIKRTGAITYNNGNAQTDLIHTFRPKYGVYKVLVTAEDSCTEKGTDIAYQFFTLTVNDVGFNETYPSENTSCTLVNDTTGKTILVGGSTIYGVNAQFQTNYNDVYLYSITKENWWDYASRLLFYIDGSLNWTLSIPDNNQTILTPLTYLPMGHSYILVLDNNGSSWIHEYNLDSYSAVNTTNLYFNAFNIDSSIKRISTYRNSSCTGGVNLGCMDVDADNYDSGATYDDGSCTYSSYGCTNALATNYNENATYDDGSCTYTSEDNLPPVAILEVDSNQVSVGESVCWDTRSSFDPDGTITQRRVIANGQVVEDKLSDCFTSLVDDIVEVSLQITDNNGSTDTDMQFVAFNLGDTACVGNTAPSLKLNITQSQDNYYLLSAIATDNDSTKLSYTWTANGKTLKGNNIIVPIAYTQDVIASVTDGCNITTELKEIDVGINLSLTESPEVIISCSANDYTEPPSDVTCVGTYDIKRGNFSKMIWSYDSELTNNSNSLVFQRTLNDKNPHIFSLTIFNTDGFLGVDTEVVTIGSKPDSEGSAGGEPQITLEDIIDLQESEKQECNIELDPKTIKITDNNLVQQIKLTNREIFSLDPKFILLNKSGDSNIFNKLRMTNEIPIIDTDRTGTTGVRLSTSGLSSGKASGTLIITSTKCKKIVIPIEIELTNVSTMDNLFASVDFDKPLAQIIKDLGNLQFLKTKATDSDLVKFFKKIFSVLGLSAIISIITLFALIPTKYGHKYSKNALLDIFVRGLIWASISVIGFAIVWVFYYLFGGK